MNLENEIDIAEENKLENICDDGQRHDVNVKYLPLRVFEGFCFRPLTGWRNAQGNFEISKEVIEFTQSTVSLFY